MLAQVLGAAQRAGVSTDDSAAAMRASARQPSQPPVRQREPLPPLQPSTRTVMSVGAAVLGDHEGRYGAAGDTPLVSEAGSQSGSASGGERGESEEEREAEGEEEEEGEEGEEEGEEEQGEEEGEEEDAWEVDEDEDNLWED
jgi:hypothetical protein